MTSLRPILSRRITADLLSRTLGHLRSVTATLPPKTVAAVCQSVVDAHQPAFVVRANNDLGIVLARVEAALERSDDAHTPEAYARAIAEDGLSDTLLNETAASICQVVSPQLVTLRTTTMPAVEHILSTAAERVAKDAPDDGSPSVWTVTWGRLNEPAYLEAVLMTASERQLIARRGQYYEYQVDAIADALKPPAVETLTPLNDAKLRAELAPLIEEAEKAEPEADPVIDPMPEISDTPIVDLITDPGARMQFSVTVRGVLANARRGRAVRNMPVVIQTLGRVSRVSDRLLANPRLEAAVGAGRIGAMITALRGLQDEVLLMHAGLLVLRETTFANTLIWTASSYRDRVPVNEAVWRKNTDLTPAVLVEHSEHLTVNNMKPAVAGVSVTEVRQMRDHVAATAEQRRIERARTKERRRNQSEVMALQEALESYHTDCTRGSRVDQGHVAAHQRLVNATIDAARRSGHAASAAVTQYVVELSGNPLIKALDTELRAAINALACEPGPITDAARNRATVKAVASVVFDVLKTSAFTRP